MAKRGPKPGNPPPTAFGGPRGNIPGKTSDQRKAEIAAAEKAAKIREMMLDAVVNLIEDETDPGRLAYIQKDILNLVHNALDRGYGKAAASLDVTSSDGSASLPSTIRLVGPGDADDPDDDDS